MARRTVALGVTENRRALRIVVAEQRPVDPLCSARAPGRAAGLAGGAGERGGQQRKSESAAGHWGPRLPQRSQRGTEDSWPLVVKTSTNSTNMGESPHNGVGARAFCVCSRSWPPCPRRTGGVVGSRGHRHRLRRRGRGRPPRASSELPLPGTTVFIDADFDDVFDPVSLGEQRRGRYLCGHGLTLGTHCCSAPLRITTLPPPPRCATS
jgi:hypothetical protein